VLAGISGNSPDGLGYCARRCYPNTQFVNRKARQRYDLGNVNDGGFDLDQLLAQRGL